MNPAPRRLVVVLALLTLIPLVGPPSTMHQPAPSRRAMQLNDIIAWKTIGATALSNDGQWFGYRLAPSEGDAQVILRQTSGDRELKFDIGDPQATQPPIDPGAPPSGPPAASSTAVQFSDDGKWAAFTTYPSRAEAQRLRRQRRPVESGVGVVNLATGEKRDYARIRRFAFSGEASTWIALHRPAASQGAGGAAGASGASGPTGATGAGGAGGGQGVPDAPKGTDLILRELATGVELNVGNVSEFGFTRDGRFLALAIDARDKIGNGLQLRDMRSGTVTVLDSGAATYERLAWAEKGDALAVLKGTDVRALRDKRYSVIGFTDIAGGAPRKTTYDPESDQAFPAEMTVSGNRDPRWTDDRQALLFGIHHPRRRDPTPDAPDSEPGAAAEARDADTPPTRTNADERVDLVLWHWQDGRLQSQQQVQEQRDRNFSYLAEYRIDSKTFIRLADEEMRTVNVAPGDRWAVGMDDREYELSGNLSGQRFQDVFAVDLRTGERKLASRRVRWFNGVSPDGTSFLFYEDGHYHVYTLATGQTRNITQGVAASFVDTEDDHNVVKPPAGAIGWASDSKSVLVHDNWDVWQIPVTAGTQATKLTVNGRQDAIRYQNRFALEPPEDRDKGIDVSKPLYFRAYGEWTKKAGIARVNPGKPGVELLTWGDAAFTRLAKAKNADRFVYTRETVAEPPDYFATDAAFAPGARLTDLRPQLADFEWSAGSMLINYTSDKGDRLQAALFLPANYKKGRAYPTVVNFYEKMSQTAHTFAQPTANGFNRSVYTSNGYAVLMPDITYRVNDPGMSAVWCMVPAVQAAIATGIVDPKHVGITGHSWGGYQTSHLVTQTDIFAAAVAGAPLTNMVSMYSLIYKNTGGGNGAIFESSQGRFKGGYWDNWDAYYRNSPVFFAKNVKTPLMLLHNDRDGAVDFTQGVEFFNTLRRLGKPVIMLEYVGENHNLRKPANQRDYTVRMKEFFDHHLMGMPAPEWMIKGVPRLKMEEHLKERAQPKPAPKRPTTTTSPQGR
jgi:dipeptidyl aminopeptidase/acylaminoacyl peptidase